MLTILLFCLINASAAESWVESVISSKNVSTEKVEAEKSHVAEQDKATCRWQLRAGLIPSACYRLKPTKVQITRLDRHCLKALTPPTDAEFAALSHRCREHALKLRKISEYRTNSKSVHWSDF